MVTTSDHVIAMHGGRQAAVFQRHGSREHADSLRNTIFLQKNISTDIIVSFSISDYSK